MFIVFVAIAAFLNPEAFNLGEPGNIKLGSLIEMSIGAAVGAITFSGSIIAFLKLQGIMSGAPITFKGQHPLNALILISIIILTYLLCSTQSSNFFWILLAVSFFIGFLLIIPIGGADMPVVISMLNSYSGWAAAGIGFTVVTGGAGFVGSNMIGFLLKKTKFKIISIDNYSSGSKKNHLKDKRIKYIKSDTKNISKKLDKYKKDINSLFHFGEFSRIYQSFLKMNECILSNMIGTYEVFNFCLNNKTLAEIVSKVMLFKSFDKENLKLVFRVL